jgi:prolyl oligopeptidase
MPLTVDRPPRTPVEPVIDVLHGVSITDPYRWLEDQNSLRTRKWLEEQTAYTRAYLDAIPGRDRIRKRVEELLAVEVISEPWKVGNRYFYLKRSAYQEQPVIMMREGDAEEEVALVDPAGRHDGTANSVRILNVSRDGLLLAYGIARGGDYSHSIEILDVNRRQVLPDRLPLGIGYGFVFSPNGRGFYYSHEIANSARPHYRAVYRHEFGAKRDEDSEIFVAGEDSKLHLELVGSTDDGVLGYRVTRTYDPPRYDFYLHDVFRRKPPRKLLKEAGSLFLPSFVGKRLFALTDWEAPNLRVVAMDLDDTENNGWFTVVPESNCRITSFAVIGSLVCVARIENMSTRIEAFDLSGHLERVVACPPMGTVRLLRRPIETTCLFYEFSSFNRPPAILSYHPIYRELKTWAETNLTLDASSIEVNQVHYESKDGTKIPMFLVARKGLQPSNSTPLPTFLTGYGGFGTSLTPQFKAYSTFLIEHGFLFAISNLRGGGEFGEEWHRAGKRQNRQKVIDDFVAAAEWLVTQGYTTPEKTAIGGGSNGGLLVGAALTQRPDLFRAAVCVGPLLDMIRYHFFDSAHFFTEEYGSSENEEDFRHLLAYSPYHHINDGVFYPAVMLISGDSDRCCNPLHARKMAARLQSASTSALPILLDYKAEWGHAPLQPLHKRIEALTDRLAFICHELDVKL